MLEILALVFFSRKIGDIAERKGLKRGWWRFYTILFWFVGEFIGAVVGILVLRTEDMLPILPFAWGFAVASFFIIKAIVSRKPDVIEPAFEFEIPNQHQQ